MKRVIYDGAEKTYNMLFSVEIVPGEQELADGVAAALVAAGLVRYADERPSPDVGIKVDPAKDPAWKRRKSFGTPDAPAKDEKE